MQRSIADVSSYHPIMRDSAAKRNPEVTEILSDGIFGAIGGTPLVRLARLFPDAGFTLFGKLESLNPGGSIKDRPAREILSQALSSGRIGLDTVVVESSSGNMGIGLAQACRYLGIRFICVVDSKTTLQNIAVLRAYGAEVEIVTEPDPETGELLQARLKRVQELCARSADSFWPNQYANLGNSDSHYRTTMEEVVAELDGQVDYVFIATSTCGTIRGCGQYVRDHMLDTKIVAVDALGSMIFSDRPGVRSIPGLGAGLRPPLCDPGLIDDFIHVDDLECVAGCRRLVQREAILAGGSSGAVVAAISRYRDRIPHGARCVAILPDRGERYLETVYSDRWIEERFGDVAHLWEDEPAFELSRAS